MTSDPTDDPRPLLAGAPEAPDPTLGHVLADRYRIDALVARGGMARVYRARDDRLGRDVAVKILSLPYAADAGFTARFLEEARAAASISHMNLVHVYDSGSDGAMHFIVMELLDDYRSLRQVLADKGRLGVEATLDLGRELLHGLRAVHARGLVHCDVKSGNVMLGPGPTKLIDFGIARLPDHVLAGDTSIGSLLYMSPEQLRGEALTPASDLFALGVVLYEALSGRVPYRGETPTEVAEAHGHEPAPPSMLVPAVPTRFDAAILQALRPDPRQRFESAAAMARALETIEAPAEEETQVVFAPLLPRSAGYVPPAAPPRARAASPPAAPRRAPARRRRAPWGAIGTALVLAAAALVGLLLVVPLLQLGRDAAAPSATSSAGATPTPTADEPPGTVLVPDTIGMNKKDAIAAANAAGLNWEIRCAQDPQRPDGMYDQEPQADTPVAPGSSFVMFSARIKDCR